MLSQRLISQDWLILFVCLFAFIYFCPGDHIQRRAFLGGSGIGQPAAVKRGHACYSCCRRSLCLWRLQQLFPSHGQDLVLSGYVPPSCKVVKAYVSSMHALGWWWRTDHYINSRLLLALQIRHVTGEIYVNQFIVLLFVVAECCQ